MRMTVRACFGRLGLDRSAAAAGGSRAVSGSGVASGPSTLPSATVSVASARSSSAPSSWVTMISVTPAERSACRASRTALWAALSSPASGSSSTRTLGCAATRPASMTRRCSPPLSSWTAVAEAVRIQPDGAQGGVRGLPVGPSGVADVLADGGAQQRERGCWIPAASRHAALRRGRPSRATVPVVGV